MDDRYTTLALSLLVAACGRIGYELEDTGARDATAPEDGQSASDANVLTGDAVSFAPDRWQGVILAYAVGEAPGAPSEQPSHRHARITWAAFTGASASEEAVLIRAPRGMLEPRALSEPLVPDCDGRPDATCVVCIAPANTAATCEDGSVAQRGRYDYAVGLRGGDGPFVADAALLIDVPIPPPNMALVQRDSVNREICALMGRASDPLRANRCPYRGLGARPFHALANAASPLDLGADNPVTAPAFYDFGYHLLIDRWEAGCAWTRESAGGRCGPAGAPGDCYGTDAPAADIGVDGNVYYRASTGWSDEMCFVRVGTSWRSVNDPGAGLERAYTIDPASSLVSPPITSVTQSAAARLCNAVVDPSYGPKRLLRLREFIAAAAWPTFPDEPGRIAPSTITALESGADLPSTGACNTNRHAGIVVSAGFPDLDEELIRLAPSRGGSSDPELGSEAVRIGSEASRRCVSRYGAQDLVGNVLEWTSDQLLTCDDTTLTCAGVTSSLDPANRALEGFAFDGSRGPGGPPNADAWEIASGAFGTTHLAVPLGLPLVGDDGGEAAPLASVAAHLHGDFFWLDPGAGGTGSGADRGIYAGSTAWRGDQGGRFAIDARVVPEFVGWGAGMRCVIGVPP